MINYIKTGKYFYWIFLILVFSIQANGQSEKFRIDPPNWWAGMEDGSLQLMVYGNNFDNNRVTVKGTGVDLIRSYTLESKSYLFLELDISKASPGTFEVKIKGKGGGSFSYDLLAKPQLNQSGIDGSDVMYLITPDRFANGDTENDQADGVIEKADRALPGGRHGGDIKGVHEHLDYLKELGVTVAWLNPVYENNMDVYSYHGYSITDHYAVDPRFGTMEDYVDFVEACHTNGIKVIKDMIFNHIGSNHPWMKDLPARDWINQWPEFTQTSYVGAVVSDPHASTYDKDVMVRGWFVPTMPDLNQQNAELQKYLVQQSIWWIATSGIDGIRMDTYPYPFKEPMKEWVQAVKTEFPDFYIVGETWLHQPSQEGYWQNDGVVASRGGYDSDLPSVSDFPLHYAIQKAFAEGGSIMPVYEVLAQDFVYSSPNDNKIFLDNHDVDRFYGKIGEDFRKYQQALALLLTTRGIPQIYYGTELLMKKSGDHGLLREDFPGGWEGDERNAFTRAGRTELENRAFDFTRKLLNWRASKPELFAKGKLVHFIPFNELYVFGRYTEDDRIITVINNSDKPTTLDLTGRFKELLSGDRPWIDIVSDNIYDDPTDILVEGRGVLILYKD